MEKLDSVVVILVMKMKETVILMMSVMMVFYVVDQSKYLPILLSNYLMLKL